MNAQDLWDAYCSATGHSGPLPDIDQFGDTPELADELLALVLNHTKRATCCLARDFTTQARPKQGDHWIITDGAGQAACIIKTTDKTLAYWKREHDAYFTRQATREGFSYDDKMLGLCEAFEKVWPNN